MATSVSIFTETCVFLLQLSFYWVNQAFSKIIVTISLVINSPSIPEVRVLVGRSTWLHQDWLPWPLALSLCLLSSSTPRYMYCRSSSRASSPEAACPEVWSILSLHKPCSCLCSVDRLLFTGLFTKASIAELDRQPHLFHTSSSDFYSLLSVFPTTDRGITQILTSLGLVLQSYIFLFMLRD